MFGKRQSLDGELTKLRNVRDETLKAVADLQTQVNALEEKLESIDYEWTDWYDKFRRLHGRIAKRQARDEAETEEPAGSPNGLGPIPADSSLNGVQNPLALALLKRGIK